MKGEQAFAILAGLIAKSGGSGGGENAVEYVPQTPTEDQQTQARENLGLYRAKTIRAFEPITFDGDVTGKTVVDFGEGMSFVQVSNDPIPLEDMVGSTIVSSAGYSFITTQDEFVTGDGYYKWTDSMIVTLRDNIDFYGFVFPSAGVYAIHVEDTEPVYLVSITAPTMHTIHKIEPEYLPDTVVTTEEQTFTDVQKMQVRANLGLYRTDYSPKFDTIMFDGDVTGKTVVEYSDNYRAVLVSDIPISLDDINGAKVVFSNEYSSAVHAEFAYPLTDDISQAYGIDLSSGDEGGGGLYVIFQDDLVVQGIGTFPKKGVYVLLMPYTPIYIAFITSPLIAGDIHKIEPEYLPDTIPTRDEVAAMIAEALANLNSEA